MVLVAFVGYFLMVLAIGILATRFSSRGLREFFLAGRRLNSFVVALSAVSSGRSAWLIIGVTGMAYVRGVSAIWAILGYTLVEFWMFLSLAPRLREWTARMDDITIPDFLASRFHDRSHLLRWVSVTIIVLFMVTYIAAQFVGGGKAFSSTFGMSMTAGVLLTAAIVLFYTLLGGFLAVSLTDVLQAVFMLIGLVVLPVKAIVDLGGWHGLVQRLQEDAAWMLDPWAIGVGALIGFLGIGLGSPGSPHILVRYMSIDNPRNLRISALWGTFWNIVMGIGAVLAGVAGRAYFPRVTMLPNRDVENLFPTLAQEHLHPLLFGLTISAVLAAIMSTADSMLLVAASGVVRDIYQKILCRGAAIAQDRLVRYSRWTVFVIVVLSVFLGFYARELVFWFVLFAWSGLGAAFGPIVILGLFWPKTNRWGALAGMITGTVVTIVWNQTPVLKTQIYELVPAFMLSTVATVVVSLWTRSPAEDR